MQQKFGFDSDTAQMVFSCTQCRARFNVHDMDIGAFDDCLAILCSICQITMALEGRWHRL